VSTISLVPNKSSPAELKEMAETLREVADGIEEGEFVSVAWIATHATGNEFSRGWVKSSSITTIELVGSVFYLLQTMTKEIDS